jgi:hypothetical protein
MAEYLTDPNNLGVVLLLFSAIAAISLVVSIVLPRWNKKPDASVRTAGNWHLTGKIDFHCPETPRDEKVPAAFLLRVEEHRSVESISGVEHVEIRWRNAALTEAKSVVIAHQSATDVGTKSLQIPRLVGAPSLAIDGSGDERTVIPAKSLGSR